MKVDLTTREIELILLLVNEIAMENWDSKKNPAFSLEELTLIEKLETALRKEDIVNKTIPNSSQSNLLH